MNLKSKELGQVFTPIKIVNQMLDLIDYNNEKILDKKILEPSFGDGIFLLEIINRYIRQCKSLKYNKKKIENLLSNNIYGIEIDKSLFDIVLNKLKSLPYKVEWKIYNADTLKTNLNISFDYVIGNPPYIKLHNLSFEYRNFLKNNFKFTKNGTIDTYIAFYEYALNNIKNNGKIIYITPNMYFRNTTNKNFRDYIIENNLINTIIDFKDEKVFKDFNTYTCITLLCKNNKNFKVYENDKFLNTFHFNDFINRDFIFLSNENQTKFFNGNIFNSLENIANIQYGLCTMRDTIYITDNYYEKDNNFYFNNYPIEKEMIKNCYKGTKLHKNEKLKIIFPYEKRNNKIQVIPENKLKEKYPLCYRYLLENKKELLKRDITNKTLWYEYGRNQGIQNIFNEKIGLDIMINGGVNCKILKKEDLIYSGIFITCSNIKNILTILKSSNFFEYCRLFGKDLQNNYKTITTTLIKKYCYE